MDEDEYNKLVVDSFVGPFEGLMMLEMKRIGILLRTIIKSYTHYDK